MMDTNLTEAQSSKILQEMRDWVLECDWVEDEESLQDLSSEEILKGIQAHYAGGVQGFIKESLDYYASVGE